MRRITTALIFVVASISISGCEKYELDQRMSELCKKDGGMAVYETVKLPPDMFDQFGKPKSVAKSTNGGYVSIIADDYIGSSEMTYIKSGNPLNGKASLARIHTKITRIKDGAILSEGIRYLRAGGDWIAIGHFSQKDCPNMPLDLVANTFAKQ